jgi:carbonic anhydrase/acetyltransferase-like protein (isoleucine patch superfamily)
MSGRHHDWPTRLRLDPTAFVAPGAVVVGEVTLGARASVWFNTVLRGDVAPITVGADSNVQDLTTVHVDEGLPAVIGARVTVGHRAIVHGCVIEDDTLIGMGAIVLSGARVGAGSLVGAGALVREGQVIPPGSLALGTPARITGPVGDGHRAAIAEGAAHYATLAAGYRARGLALAHPLPGSVTGIAGDAPAPMGFMEWGQVLAALAASPDWVADRLARHPAETWRRTPAPGGWSALEVLCHLRDADRDVCVPRLARVLAEDGIAVDDVDMAGWEDARGYRGQDVNAVLAEWRAARAGLVRLLAPLGRRDWARHVVHSVRGPWSVGAMARSWADHDLGHRRQIAVALGERA